MAKNVYPKQKGQPSTTINEILYSDNEYILSFDSQLHKGTESSLSKELSQSVGMEDEIGISVAVKGHTSNSSVETNKISHIISPHDYKILQLIADLELKRSSETATFNNGQIVLLSGAIQFFDITYMQELIKKLDKYNILDELKNKQIEADEILDLPSLAEENQYNLMNMIFEFLPKDSYFLLRTNNDRRYRVFIQPDYLRQPMNMLQDLYGAGLSGEWNIVGIYNTPNKLKVKAQGLSDHFVEIYKAYSELFLKAGLPDEIITPILIYRKLQF